MAKRSKAITPTTTLPDAERGRCIADYHSPCRNRPRCFDCWYTAGYNKTDRKKGRDKFRKLMDMAEMVEAQTFVIDGISMLAELLSEKHRVQTGVLCSPHIGYDRSTGGNTPPPFSNGTFALRSYEQSNGNEPLFSFPMDFDVRWYQHINQHPMQTRKLKGKEWVQMMSDCMRSLGAK